MTRLGLGPGCDGREECARAQHDAEHCLARQACVPGHLRSSGDSARLQEDPRVGGGEYHPITGAESLAAADAERVGSRPVPRRRARPLRRRSIPPAAQLILEGFPMKTHARFAAVLLLVLLAGACAPKEKRSESA